MYEDGFWGKYGTNAGTTTTTNQDLNYAICTHKTCLTDFGEDKKINFFLFLIFKMHHH